MGTIEDAARKRRAQHNDDAREYKETVDERRAFREKHEADIGFGYDPSRGGISTLIKDKPAKASAPAPMMGEIPWRSPEIRDQYRKHEADDEIWKGMQEQQRWAEAPETPGLGPFRLPEEKAAEASRGEGYGVVRPSSGGGGGGAYSGYSSRSSNPSYAKWLDTYTVEAALNARDRDELAQVNQSQQDQAHARADWNQERAFEQRETMDLANQELGMMRSELGNASRMYREQLAATGSVYNPGALSSALLGIGNAVFGGGVERGAEILNGLAQKDLNHQKLLLKNSARIEDSLLGRYEQITGDKDKAEQLYLAFTKDQQAEQARVLALKVTNVETRNRLNQKAVELTRDREGIEYKIESQLAQQRQAAAARAMAARRAAAARATQAGRPDIEAFRKKLMAATGGEAGPAENAMRALYGPERLAEIKSNKEYRTASADMKITHTVHTSSKRMMELFAKYKGQDYPGLGVIAGYLPQNDFTNWVTGKTADEVADANEMRELMALVSNSLSTGLSKGNPSESENKSLSPIVSTPNIGMHTLKEKTSQVIDLMESSAGFYRRNMPDDAAVVFTATNMNLFPTAKVLQNGI